MEIICAIVPSIGSVILIKNIYRLFKLLLNLSHLNKFQPMSIQDLKKSISQGEVYGIFGQSRVKQVILKGILYSNKTITSQLGKLNDAMFSIFRKKTVFSNLNYKRTLSILQKQYNKAKFSICSDLSLKIFNQSLPIIGVRQLLFSQSLGKHYVQRLPKQLDIIQKILVFINNMIPFRWCFRLVKRGQIKNQFLIRNKREVIINTKAVLDDKGRLFLQGGSCFRDKQQWLRSMKIKVVKGFFKVLFGLLFIVFIIYQYWKNYKNKKKINQEGKLMGVENVTVRKCIQCQQTKASIFQKPCRHIILCKTCFKQGICRQCGLNVSSFQQIFFS